MISLHIYQLTHYTSEAIFMAARISLETCSTTTIFTFLSRASEGGEGEELFCTTRIMHGWHVHVFLILYT